MSQEEKQISSRSVFSGHIMDVEVADVKLPDGKMTTREIVRHAPAVAILAIDDDQQMLLMRQWRAAVDQATLEIPAGKVDDRDQNAIDAAHRELNEETRLATDNLTKVSSFYTSVGFSDEYMTLFLAQNLIPVTQKLPQDEDENLQLEKVTLDKALEMIKTGKICDAKTIMAVYYWQTLTLRGDN
ncbi:ADP-ribose pyrophosphatase [Paucilactobacillus hokkaidonensis JCM 18461]|uniref:ADP-ribose pyrophosphatase n=2 Tax=Paucilactobacillus hokkaidonensis TaxID=1193095 RepID=A0A0A1GV76_9LACO|nr:NUDIX hydrolase [Paucilactobacillus hokkaidonensis]KRO09924.1 MutT NUDIX family protein [Paucilactobacillus hokkaidonensis]BAP85905.1 ADP-ribose pyrophosphatase [Paucilactobacillus hokkaidonensis JCM 18461]